MRSRRLLRRLAPLVALVATSGVFASTYEAERAAFVDAWPNALKGIAPDAKTARLLKDYPLWPDMQAAVFSANLATTPAAELDAFMQAHGDLAP
ncbi:MAG: hypothetical protein AAAFM81_02400, partial [Pseudomonadota bacterium]